LFPRGSQRFASLPDTEPREQTSLKFKTESQPFNQSVKAAKFSIRKISQNVLDYVSLATERTLIWPALSLLRPRSPSGFVRGASRIAGLALIGGEIVGAAALTFYFPIAAVVAAGLLGHYPTAVQRINESSNHTFETEWGRIKWPQEMLERKNRKAKHEEH